KAQAVPKAEDEDVVMGGTGEAREYPPVPGLEHHVDDDTGQHFYHHPSGIQFFWDFEHGDVRPLPSGVRFRIGQSSGTRQTEPEAMDVDTDDDEAPSVQPAEEADDEMEEEYVGKGKKPAGRRR
ncbi:MAG TPA: hypothetical protein VNO31_12005, partial [Umezawaea sp.]|nr:hypothetical protein [Umezawaea sp.]